MAPVCLQLDDCSAAPTMNMFVDSGDLRATTSDHRIFAHALDGNTIHHVMQLMHICMYALSYMQASKLTYRSEHIFYVQYRLSAETAILLG